MNKKRFDVMMVRRRSLSPKSLGIVIIKNNKYDHSRALFTLSIGLNASTLTVRL